MSFPVSQSTEMGLLFTKRTPCSENEHLYAIEKEFDLVLSH